MPQIYLKDESGEVIEVPEGESSVGRGPLLKVTDKRVSRNHALLYLENDKLKLCPKHRNPCFYKASGKDVFSVLPKDVWQELHNGDLISLLPDDLVFRVVEESPADLERWGGSIRLPAHKVVHASFKLTMLHEAPTVAERFTQIRDFIRRVATHDITAHRFHLPLSDKSAQPEPKKESIAADTDIMDDLFEPMETTPKAEEKQSHILKDVVHKSIDPDAKKRDPSPVSMRAVDHSLPTQEPFNDASSTMRIDTSEPSMSATEKDSGAGKLLSKTSSAGKARTLPAWLSELSSGTKPPTKKRKAPSKTASKCEEEESHPPPPKKTAKRSTTEDTKPPETKEWKGGLTEKHKDEEKTLKAVGTGVAKDTSATRPSLAVTTTECLAKKEAKKDEKKLPQCPYGTTCYRKNPIHFQEYSHDFSATPDDTNSGEENDDDDKPMCPYGTACYRKNPVHWKEYRHTGTPAVGAAVGTRHSDRNTKGKKRSLLSGDSDDDGEPNTYDYTDSFLDDQDIGDSSSSCGGDSEDSDWAPPVEDSEDVRGLLAEATSFISNKKMRKPT